MLPNAVSRYRPRRHSWLFAGSNRATAIYTLIATTLNNINPQARLADVLARIADHPASRLNALLPGHWKQPQ